MKSTISILLSKSVAVASVLAILGASATSACTGVRLQAKDGSVVAARTLEFGVDLKSDVIAIPRGFEHVGTTPDGKPGKTWKAKYASLGANGLELPLIFDGLNEKGLGVGLFYFPTSAGYQNYSADDAGKTLAPWEVGSYMLENFSSVDEVKTNIGNIVVPAVVYPAWHFSPPVHYVVHDATGKSIVIEYVDGKRHVYDNPLGVFTNSPTFDWHMTNLRNYVNFSITNHEPVKLGSVLLVPFGQGSGMLGMPGDFTPPSRFVRAAAFSQSVLPSKTGWDAVVQSFHILNNFDIPKGAAREAEKDEHGNVVADYTLWTSASDLKNKKYYFRTHENSQIRLVDLNKLKLDGKDISKWSMQGDEVAADLSANNIGAADSK